MSSAKQKAVQAKFRKAIKLSKGKSAAEKKKIFKQVFKK